MILLRRTAPGFEVLLVRRHRAASFMASAYVFPGGAAESDEDARTAAARELFEEAGVLLAKDAGLECETLELMTQATLRKKILAGGDPVKTLALAGLAWSTDMLVPWAHWITPSVETKRFSARFFVCELPPGQSPSFDTIETVDQVWVAPADGLARSGELALPPPQVRTLWELAQHRTIEEVLAAGRERADEPHPIMPRLLAVPDGAAIEGATPCLLLPWDPAYVDGGTGEATPLSYTPRWATGPTRFVMEDRAWRHVAAPGSTSAG